MTKKFIIFFLILLIFFSLTSCSFINHLYDMQGDLARGENESLIYQNKVYYYTDQRFEVRTNSDDIVVELGWQYAFPFPDFHYFAFDNEDPLFIFMDNNKSSPYNKAVYVRENFELDDATFIVENTDIEITLSESMTKSDIEITSSDFETTGASIFRDLYLYLNNDPRIQIHVMGPYKYESAWYVNSGDGTWLLSDEFVSILIENDIISE